MTLTKERDSPEQGPERAGPQGAGDPPAPHRETHLRFRGMIMRVNALGQRTVASRHSVLSAFGLVVVSLSVKWKFS